MDFQNNTTQIILAIIALFAVGIVIKISTKKKSKTSTSGHIKKCENGRRYSFFGDKTTKTEK
ncbi:hypothetical protein [Flavobacterium lindanitolerans]|uniref:hypothetical protein n=1 Tax=Flavobacterium lindanitolerans TaxID=428988 RepID=UPI0031D84400